MLGAYERREKGREPLFAESMSMNNVLLAEKERQRERAERVTMGTGVCGIQM